MTHAVMAFGRMNPPTTGHEKLIKKVHSHAKKVGGSAHIIASHSEGSSDNPIPQRHKIGYIKKIAPSGVNVSGSSKSQPTLLHHAARLHAEGHEHLTVVAGSDRKKEFHSLLHRYNGKKGAHGHYNFKSINVVSSGRRDPDSYGTSGVSGTSMRGHARSGDHASFKKGLPKALHPHQKEITDHINSVREEKEMSAAGKKGMADFQKKQERMRLKKLSTNYEKSRRKTNTFGYGSYGPKQFAEANLPPHLAKFVDKKGDLKPEVAKRVQKARKKSMFKIIDRTPKGYGNEPENSTPAPWKDARVTKEEIELAENVPAKPVGVKSIYVQSKSNPRLIVPGNANAELQNKRAEELRKKRRLSVFKKYAHEEYKSELTLDRQGSTGRYSDEHAHANMWNYAVDKNITTAEELHAHLKAAKNNKDHPLHHSNHDEGWKGEPNEDERQVDHHHDEHRKAANTIGHLLQQKEFKDSHANGHRATVGGGEQGDLSDLYKDHKVKPGTAATSKTDIHIGPTEEQKTSGDKHPDSRKISLKQSSSANPSSHSASDLPSYDNHGVRLGKGGTMLGGKKVHRPGTYTVRAAGHVLMSGGPAETAAAHHHAITNYLDKHKDHAGKSDAEKKALHAELMKHVHAGAAALTASGGHPYDHKNGERNEKGKIKIDPEGRAAAREHLAKADNHFKTLHEKHPGLIDHLVREAGTGAGKFKNKNESEEGKPHSSPAVPTHYVKVGQNTAAPSAVNEARKSPLQKLKDFDKVRVAVGKKPIFRSNEKKVKPMKEIKEGLGPMGDAHAHMKKDGANHKDIKVSHRYQDHHMAKAGYTHRVGAVYKKGPFDAQQRDYRGIRVGRTMQVKVDPELTKTEGFIYEEVDPHIKTMISKGDSDEKIKKMHPEITDDELKSCRQKYVKEELELQEVLTLMQRMKRSRTMRRFSKKIARRKSILSKRIAPKKNLAKRARRAAVRLARKKYAGKKGQQYNKLSIGDKMMVDKRIATKKLIIGKIAKRLMPKVRKAELTRLRSKGKKKVTAVKGSAAREQFDYENQLWEFVKHFDNIKVRDLAAIEEKAIKSGLDVDVLMEVFDRGLEDWDEKSGTLSPEQHAFNRLNSFIASGKARELDEDLIEEDIEEAKYKVTSYGGMVPIPDKEKTGHSIDLFGKHIRRGEAESKTAFDIGHKHGSEGKPSNPKEHGIYQKHYKAGYNSGKQKIKEDIKKRTPAGVTPGYMAGKGKTFFQNRRDLADRGIKSKPIDKDKFFGKKKVKEDHDVNSLFLEFQATGERSSVADPIDPKKVNWKVKRGDSYLPFKHKRMPEEVEVGKTFKKGDTVTPSIGPHKGVKHEVIHDHGDGSYNIKPVGLQPKQIRYGMGAAKAKAKHLELHNEDTSPYEEAIDRSIALANLRRMQKKVETKQTAKKVEKYVKEKGVTKVPPGEPEGIEKQTMRPKTGPHRKGSRRSPTAGRKGGGDQGYAQVDYDPGRLMKKEETEVDEGKIAGSIRWVRKWKAEGHSKEEAHRKAKEMDIHPKVVDDHYKKNNNRPGMGLHLLNRQNENVEKAELKVQHAKDKLTLAKDHKSDKARLRRMKDV